MNSKPWNLQKSNPQPYSRIDPEYIIVDVRDVMTDYSRHRQLYPIYRHFPLPEMIQCILSVAAYGDHGDYFWMELDNRFERANARDLIDYDMVSLFYEMLTTYLDEYIRSKLPQYVDNCEFVFHRWINQTTVMLQKDANAQACNRLM